VTIVLTILITLAAVAAWFGCGARGYYLHSTHIGWMTVKSKRRAQIYQFLGPIFLFVTWIDGISPDLRMNRADKKNPFHDELREVLRLRRGLQWVPGDDASRERKELEAVIEELREWPSKLKAQDGDRLVAAMRAEYETAKLLSRTRLEAYKKIEQDITEEVRRETNR
jgi:hypothetical protein